MAQSHPSPDAYDASFFAASTSSTPPITSYAPYLPSHAPAAAPFSPFPSTPYSAGGFPPSSHAYSSAPAPASGMPDAPPTFPGIGRIRCYWTILTPQLEYAYLDPILQLHMGEWVHAFRGSNVLDWVHPDEREQLAEDLLPKEDGVGGVEGAGVFGSVTRCRYSRLTSILRRLGCQQPPSPPDAEVYTLDDDYLNLDITTSWIAGDRKGKGREGQQGAVLAFFHVTADKDPVQDNDSEHRTEWSNWCGASHDYPSYMTSEQCSELVAALARITGPTSSAVGRPSTSSGESDKGALNTVLNGVVDDGPPAHVFQLLDESGRAIATFPEGEGGPDGAEAYDVEQFSALAREVMARPREAVQSKTSCTRRYRSKHPVMRNGTLTTVESVVIMYGAVTFACFQTGGVYLSSARKAGLSLVTSDIPADVKPSFALEDVPVTPTVGSVNAAGKRNSYGEQSNGSDSPPAKRFKETPLQPPVLPRLQTSAPSSNGGSASPRSAEAVNGLSISTSGRMFRSTLDVDSITAGGISPTVASASAILGSLGEAQPAAPSAEQPQTNARASYAAFYAAQQQQPFDPSTGLQHSAAPFFPGQTQYATPHQLPHPSPHPLSQSHSGYFTAAPQSPHEPAGAQADSGLFPPTSQPYDGQQQQQQAAFAGPSSPYPPQQQQQQGEGDGAVAVPPPPAAAAGSNGKAKSPSAKKPPKQRPDGPVYKPNQKACESCGTVNSPEWRKGPTGAKSLCNACGLRYARSVARQKKQAELAANGGVAPKKGKKKGAAAAAAAQKAAAEAAGAPPSPASSLPAGSQALTLHSPLTSAAYDLSAFTHAPHSAPKPYTPYYASAPQLPNPYSHAPSPTMTHTPQYPSPGVGVSAAPSYFPPMGYGGPYGSAPGGHPGMPMSTHAPLPPLAHAAAGAYDYARAMPPPFHHQQHPSAPMHSPHLEQHQHQQQGSAGPGSAGMFAAHSNGGQLPHPHQHQHQQREQQQQHWAPHDAQFPPQFGWPAAHSAEQRGPTEPHQHGQHGGEEQR
ncbi:hypothetical protein JCM10449v2_006622 [Rhodotorula kratochvilovae]